MKKYYWSTLLIFLTFCSAYGQRNTRGVNREFYVDGYRVYANLSKSDSNKILKGMTSEINGDWTSTEKLVPTEPAFTCTWTYQLNDTTFKGTILNPDMIMAAHFVRLEIINGQIKIIYSRAMGPYLIDERVENINISADMLTIGETIYKRVVEK